MLLYKATSCVECTTARLGAERVCEHAVGQQQSEREQEDWDDEVVVVYKPCVAFLIQYSALENHGASGVLLL
jgi:hypothetical protein